MSTPARPNRSLQLVPALPLSAQVRRIPLVVRTLRQLCAVCAGRQGPSLVWLNPGTGTPLGKGGCAHCSWGLPIAYPPMYVDQPKDAS